MDNGHPSYTVTIAQQGFQYSRDDSNPLTYNYAISLIVVKDAGDIVIAQEAPEEITNQISEQRQEESKTVAKKAKDATEKAKKSDKAKSKKKSKKK